MSITEKVKQATIAAIRDEEIIPEEIDALIAASDALTEAVDAFSAEIDETAYELFVSVVSAFTAKQVDADATEAEAQALKDQFVNEFDLDNDVVEVLVEGLFAAQQDYASAYLAVQNLFADNEDNEGSNEA